MEYLYIVSLVAALGISLSTSRILAGKISKSSNGGVYLALLLGLDIEDSVNINTLSLYLCALLVVSNVVLFYVDPLIQICLVALMVDQVLGRMIRIRRQIKNIELLIRMTKSKCEVHPEITKAICMEGDGTMFLVCPKCNPEVAEDFGVTVGDCIDDNKDLE